MSRDRLTVSRQPHEVKYLAEILAKEFPNVAPENVRGAIKAAKKNGSDRNHVLQDARAGLKTMEEKP